jgi:type I site-specific restriction endonuclease
MDAWITVVVALIVALSTLGATWLQNRHSNKRFEKELEKAKEEQKRQRRWEVESEPLLELRKELALMAAKLDKLNAAISRQNIKIGVTDEEAKKELQGAVDDWNVYTARGDLAKTLFIQYSTDLVNKVEEIRKDYQTSYYYQLYYKQIPPEKLAEAMNVFEKNKIKIVEVQELINKRLEEL